MMALNKIGDTNLYIGGAMALRNKLALARNNITHVVTVLRDRLADQQYVDSLENLHVPVDDVDDEDLLQYFPSTNSFIKSGLESGGGVLVHCAMGKSRSATVCIAFLLSEEPGRLTPEQALAFLRKSRPFCEPNEGFMKQLNTYYEMQCPAHVVSHRLYQRWKYERAVEESVACGRGPEAERILFEDEQSRANDKNAKTTQVRCRKCRWKLATSEFIIPHEPLNKEAPAVSPPIAPCAHVFLHPLTWMRPSLFPLVDGQAPSDSVFPEAPLDGRLNCPNTSCGANVGKFAWPGMPCSCGKWVVPAICLVRAKVDVIDGSNAAGALAGGGIRLPPKMRNLNAPATGRGSL